MKFHANQHTGSRNNTFVCRFAIRRSQLLGCTSKTAARHIAPFACECIRRPAAASAWSSCTQPWSRLGRRLHFLLHVHPAPALAVCESADSRSFAGFAGRLVVTVALVATSRARDLLRHQPCSAEFAGLLVWCGVRARGQRDQAPSNKATLRRFHDAINTGDPELTRRRSTSSSSRTH